MKSNTVHPQWVAIAAMGQNRGIGLRGKLPWHVPEEYKHFRETTLGHVLLMGRSTWESIGAKPLARREHWILSKTLKDAPGAVVLPTLQAALERQTTKTVFVAGGGVLYGAALPYCQSLIISIMEQSPEADTFFPEFEHLFPRRTRLKSHPEFTVWEYSHSR